MCVYKLLARSVEPTSGTDHVSFHGHVMSKHVFQKFDRAEQWARIIYNVQLDVFSWTTYVVRIKVHQKWVIYFPVIRINIFCNRCRHIRLCSSLQEKHTPLSFVFLDFNHVCLAKTHPGFLHRAAKTLCTTFFFQAICIQTTLSTFITITLLSTADKNLSRTFFTVSQKKN